MRRIAAALIALCAQAWANGRPAETSTIAFGPGDTIAAGTTFGLVVSSDGGASWYWSCEDALRYGGEYDPALAYVASGALFSTSFRGLLVTRDHCTVDPSTPLGEKFATAIARGPDNALYVALAEPANPMTMTLGDTSLYKSTDEGVTFPTSAMPAALGTWWWSVEVAPSDAQRVYASGFRVELGERVLKLFRSTDGGATYQPMGTTGLTTSPSSSMLLAGISSTNADTLFARVTYQDNLPNNDAIFRSTDAGASWTKILAKPTSLSFVVRSNGDLVAANRYAEAWVSHTNGDSWEPLVGAPHINCLVENRAGDVFACTQNYAPSDETRDNAGIMKSRDLVAWTPVLTFQDIAGPIACPVGTVQRDTCVDDSLRWCTMRRQFGITANPTACPALVDGAPIEDAMIVTPPGSGGCCDASGQPSLGIALVLLVRRRRSRS